ncbi:MAG: IclR family transcriptional regulator [Acidimicrobiales bacterium]|nr:IclR family transcriptional regulator [Acidimicrobiales bacterium]
MEPRVTGVGVIDKAVRVLDAVEHGALDLGGLVEATGLPRATAHRLAVALEAHGLVRRDDRGQFVPGLRLVALGRAASRALALPDVARPALESLRADTGESVQLYVRDGHTRVCVASLESPHGLRTIVALGASLPLEVGSAGRILGGEASAAGSPWAESIGEREAGVASVSAPVRDDRDQVVAAVSVSGPVDRMGERPGARHGEAVVAAARRIEADLNG